jgi:hypothetical protein
VKIESRPQHERPPCEEGMGRDRPDVGGGSQDGAEGFKGVPWQKQGRLAVSLSFAAL